MENKMREIKFRMWDKKNNKMCVFDAIKNNEDWNKNSRFVPMQYTGLKDKDGVEIYEGDILKCYGDFSCDIYDEQESRYDSEKECVFEIFWNNECSCFDFEYAEKELLSGYPIGDIGSNFTECLSDFLKYHEGKVLGNIYQNPELLEV